MVIVARGGGSLEDLWTFNQERVARAIAGCSVPVISAVGHETDFTIADFVADLRAPTPSAAAELVVPTRESLLEALETTERRLLQTVRLKIATRARALHRVEVDRAALHRTIGRRMQRVDELEYRVKEQMRASMERRKKALDRARSSIAQLDVRLRFAGIRRRIESAEEALRQLARLRLTRAQGRLAPLQAHLVQLSPLKILDRGYAIVENRGKIVKAPQDAPASSEVDIRVAEGRLRGRIL